VPPPRSRACGLFARASSASSTLFGRSSSNSGNASISELPTDGDERASREQSFRGRGCSDCALSPCGRGQHCCVHTLEWVRGGRCQQPSPIRVCESTGPPSPARGEGICLCIAPAERQVPGCAERIEQGSSPLSSSCVAVAAGAAALLERGE